MGADVRVGATAPEPSSFSFLFSSSVRRARDALSAVFGGNEAVSIIAI